ncbi:hypothetical protein P9112_004667 [Eukaryota sp. TZLM1-RC]
MQNQNPFDHPLDDAQKGSYKLWKHYLDRVCSYTYSFPPNHDSWNLLINTFEEALHYMRRMPVIWELYLTALQKSFRITLTRRSFDRALRSLPLTQHYRIWPLYLNFCRLSHVPHATSNLIIRRYLQYDPSATSLAVNFFKTVGNYLDLFKFLKQKETKTKQDWLELARSAASVNEPVKNDPDFDPYVIKTAINHFDYSDDGLVGELWVSLAQCTARDSTIFSARSIYLEALNTCKSRADFAVVYEAFTLFEEANIAEFSKLNNKSQLEITIGLLEKLLEVRPLLLNSIEIKQQPQSIPSWISRVRILQTFDFKMAASVDKLLCFVASKIPPGGCSGKFVSLYVMLARHRFKYAHFLNLSFDQAIAELRSVFKHGLAQKAWKFEDRSLLVTSWAENELLYSNDLNSAVNALFLGLGIDSSHHLSPSSPLPGDLFHELPPKPLNFEYDVDDLYNEVDNVEFTLSNSVLELAQKRTDFDLYSCQRSQEVWCFLYDCLFQQSDWIKMCNIFDRCSTFSLKLLLHHAHVIQSNMNDFERSFSFYEKGLAILPKEDHLTIWSFYLTELLSFYKFKAMERFRFLFRDCVSQIDPKDSKHIRLLGFYAEAKYGRPRYAIYTLVNALKFLTGEDKIEFSEYLLTYSINHFGLEKSREYFDLIISQSDIFNCIRFSLIYAKFELLVSEYERVRSIYKYAASLSPPSSNLLEIWSQWKSFELSHGTEETYAEFNSTRVTVQQRFDVEGKQKEVKFVEKQS